VSGRERPFSLEDLVDLPPANDWFPSRTGSPDHLAVFAALINLVLVQFPSRTGSPGHLACYPGSIAWEADVCKGFREAVRRETRPDIPDAVGRNLEGDFWIIVLT
jgi:hypothetical protein